MNTDKVNKKLEEIRKYARCRYIPVMLDDGAEVLTDAILKYKPKNILEIGTSLGTSGILMLTYSQAHLITIDINEEAVEIAKENFRELELIDRVDFLIGDCVEIIRMMSGKFDFIFLDGPKGQYIEMLESLLSLLDKNGILFADNVLFHNLVEQPDIEYKHRTIIKNLRKFIDTVNTNKNLEVSLVRKGDGVIIAKKLN